MKTTKTTFLFPCQFRYIEKVSKYDRLLHHYFNHFYFRVIYSMLRWRNDDVMLIWFCKRLEILIKWCSELGLLICSMFGLRVKEGEVTKTIYGLVGNCHTVHWPKWYISLAPSYSCCFFSYSLLFSWISASLLHCRNCKTLLRQPIYLSNIRENRQKNIVRT